MSKFGSRYVLNLIKWCNGGSNLTLICIISITDFKVGLFHLYGVWKQLIGEGFGSTSPIFKFQKSGYLKKAVVVPFLFFLESVIIRSN